MMPIHRLEPALLALVLAALGATGCAQSIDGKVKVGLETPLIVFGRTVLQSEESDSEDLRGTEYAVGIAPPARASYLAIGWPAPVSVDVAYGLSDHFVLGARTGVGFSTFDGDDVLGGHSSVDVLAVSLLPHLDYVFAGSYIRPFAGIETGGVYMHSAAGDASGSATLFSAGAAAGVHAFVAESLSIDPRLSVAYGFGSSAQDQLDQDVERFDVVLRLGLSGWF